MCCRKSALVVVGQFEGKSLSANVPQIPRLVTDQCLRRGISTAIAFPDEGKSGFALPADNEAQSNESQWGLTALGQQRNIVSRQPLCTGSHSTRLHKTPQGSTRLHKAPQDSTSRSAKVALLSSSLSGNDSQWDLAAREKQRSRIPRCRAASFPGERFHYFPSRIRPSLSRSFLSVKIPNRDLLILAAGAGGALWAVDEWW